nr:ABC transporter permease [Feifania hominis]
MRSFLTMLGIIIGVASVIVIVSLGQGMAQDVTDTFESMGTNLITVNLVGRGSTRSIGVDEIYTFTEENQQLLSYVTPTVSVSATMKVDNETLSTTSVTGVGEDFCQIRNYAVSDGRFLQYVDILRRQKVCVIGSYVAQTYFGGDPLGQTVKINGNHYTVIGVLEEKSGSEESSDDDAIFIPYSNATKLSRMSTISNYYFSASSKDHVSEAKTAVEQLLYKAYGDEDSYRVSTQAESIEQLNELTGTIISVLIAIAAISLFVGGIGIMNIMLVSVTERTREIGVRKSLGAKRRDIMRQFVIEAGTTSSVGGILGIVCGIGLSYVAGGLFDMRSEPSFYAVAVAFGVSLAIGVAFGFLPANKAAKLNPIDALRHD